MRGTGKGVIAALVMAVLTTAILAAPTVTVAHAQRFDRATPPEDRDFITAVWRELRLREAPCIQAAEGAEGAWCGEVSNGLSGTTRMVITRVAAERRMPLLTDWTVDHLAVNLRLHEATIGTLDGRVEYVVRMYVFGDYLTHIVIARAATVTADGE